MCTSTWDSRTSKRPHECAGCAMLLLLLLSSRAFGACTFWRMRERTEEWEWEKMAGRELHPVPEFFPHPVPKEHLVHPELISLSQWPQPRRWLQNCVPEAYPGHSSCTWKSPRDPMVSKETVNPVIRSLGFKGGQNCSLDFMTTLGSSWMFQQWSLENNASLEHT